MENKQKKEARKEGREGGRAREEWLLLGVAAWSGASGLTRVAFIPKHTGKVLCEWNSKPRTG